MRWEKLVSGTSGISLKVGTAGAGSQDLAQVTIWGHVSIVMSTSLKKVPANHSFVESDGKNKEGTQASPA